MVDRVIVDGLVDGLFPFQAQDKVEVSFIKVDDSEPMDFEVAPLIENHHINDIFPTGEGIIVPDSIVDHSLVNRGDPILEGGEGLSFLFW